MNETKWNENENPLDSVNRFKNECLKKSYYPEKEKPVVVGPKMAQWLKELYPGMVINKLEE